jgi:hypothetical protein
MVIDLFGITSDRARERFPEVYQHLAQTVRVARQQQVSRSGTADAREYLERWWEFGKPRQELRAALAGLARFVVTVETAKHRVFVFLSTEILPDNRLICFAVADAALLAVLSSSIHVQWALATGGTLEDRPIYTKTRCFDPFPFPAWEEPQRAALAEAGERLDAFRKQRLAEHPELTMTRLYNALEAHRAKLATGKAMSAQEAADFDAGSVLILDELHRTIDRLTLDAYGWPQDETTEQRLARLVALNAERAAEEARGEVRWLRPEYQKARFGKQQVAGPAQARDLLGEVPAAAAAKPTFPSDRTGQHLAVLARLHAAAAPLTPAEIAAGFKGRNVVSRAENALRALARLGYAVPTPDGRAYAARRAA